MAWKNVLFKWCCQTQQKPILNGKLASSPKMLAIISAVSVSLEEQSVVTWFSKKKNIASYWKIVRPLIATTNPCQCLPMECASMKNCGRLSRARMQCSRKERFFTNLRSMASRKTTLSSQWPFCNRFFKTIIHFFDIQEYYVFLWFIRLLL